MSICQSIPYLQFCFKDLQSQRMFQIHASVRTEQEERTHAELKIFLAVNIVAATIMTTNMLYRREENVFKGVENLPALLYTIV